LLGLGATIGFMAGFAVLFVIAHTSRQRRAVGNYTTKW
jgi:hypothetical protein